MKIIKIWKYWEFSTILGSFFCDFWVKSLIVGLKLILDIVDTGENGKNGVKNRSKTFGNMQKLQEMHRKWSFFVIFWHFLEPEIQDQTIREIEKWATESTEDTEKKGKRRDFRYGLTRDLHGFFVVKFALLVKLNKG